MEPINLFDIEPNNEKERLRLIRDGTSNLKSLVVNSTRNKGLDTAHCTIANRLHHARTYLPWLSTTNASPRLNCGDIQMKKVLGVVSHGKYMPKDISDMANEMLQQFEAVNWGQDSVLDDEDEESVENHSPIQPSAMETNTSGESNGIGSVTTSQARLPTENHPIYGRNGIMWGILVHRGAAGQRVYQLSPRVPKREAQIFGHNGLQVGAWFPLQLVALHRGAHGATMAGIAGNINLGAYSIVVSDKYEDLDHDLGQVLYYSGSNSHSNRDPTRVAPPSKGTKALQASLRTRNPIRVLRSAGQVRDSTRNRWAPRAGLRYDGLYEAVEVRYPHNGNGGKYEQFKLVRLPDQPDLEVVCSQYPTQSQVNDYGRIHGGY